MEPKPKQLTRRAKPQEPKDCCFCCSLRTGSLILCCLIQIVSILDFLCMLKVFFKTNEMDEEITVMCENKFLYEPDCHAHVKMIVSGVVSCRVAMDFLKFTFSTLMILGIKKNRAKLMLRLIVMIFGELLLSLLAGVVIVVLIAAVGTGRVALEVAGITGLVVFLETYFLIVFQAYYRQAQRGGGGSRGRRQMTRLLEEES